MSRLHRPLDSEDHVLGSASAALQIVEYGDYQCPYCGEAFPVVRELAQRYGDALAIAFRNFPLTEMHPEAYNAATVAEYAGQHGQFWAAHDALYENQALLGPELYTRIAQSLGLDLAGLQRALDNGSFDARIRHDMESGLRSGVNGTPCFFINGQRFDPVGGFDSLGEVVAQLLRGS